MIWMTGLLASVMWMISDRQEFWNTDVLSDNTQMSFIHPDGTLDAKKPKLSQLDGKKILILIHGYNNSKEDVLPAYFTIKENIDQLPGLSNERVYDEVIGYVWPGCESSAKYYEAKGHAEKVAERASHLISHLCSGAKQIDVMAHSMGNFLFLEVMKKIGDQKRITNFFSLGAALDNESIEQGETYGAAIENCQESYIVYSNEDDVLKYCYTLAEFDRALGNVGIEDIAKLPLHVQLVDCSEVVSAHDQYLKTSQIFDFIRNRSLRLPPLPENAKSVKLLENNEVVVLLPVGSNNSETANLENAK